MPRRPAEARPGAEARLPPEVVELASGARLATLGDRALADQALGDRALVEPALGDRALVEAAREDREPGEAAREAPVPEGAQEQGRGEKTRARLTALSLTARPVEAATAGGPRAPQVAECRQRTRRLCSSAT